MKIMWSKDCLVTPASFRNLVSKKIICLGDICNMIVKNF